MKILLIGSTGTIGSAVKDILSTSGHDVISASYSSAEQRVDLSDKASIASLFERVGKVDAIVCAAGQAKFGGLSALSDDDFKLGLDSKFMGQVNLVRLGMSYLNDGGSITLTSGVLAQSPMPGSAAVSSVNAAVEGFARAATIT